MRGLVAASRVDVVTDDPLRIGEKNRGGPPVEDASRSSRVTPSRSPRPCRAMLCTKVFSPAGAADEEDAEADEEGTEAPARPDGGSSSSAANAIVEAEASTAGSSSLGAVAVSTARRAVRHRRELGTADVIRDEPATRRPRSTVRRGARAGAPAAALDVATANILGRRGARCGRRAEGVRVAPLRMTCKSVETPRNAQSHENENPRPALREAVSDVGAVFPAFPFSGANARNVRWSECRDLRNHRFSGDLFTPPRARLPPAMPRGSSKAKFYGVARGREPGVYRTWDEASAQVTGIKGAVHKSFGTEAEAAAWVAAQRGGAVGDAGPSESARLRSPAASPTPSRARPSSSARPPTSPPPARRAMSTVAGSAGAADADADEDVAKAVEDAPTDASSPAPPTPLTSGRRYLLCFDGACRGNPGPSGAGALIKEDVEDAGGGRVVFTLAQYLGDALTNNESEYRALIAGLERASALGATDLRVVGDSKLVINQVTNAWKVKKPNLMPLYEEARAVIETAPFRDAFAMTHVEREKNAEADALANFAVDVGRERGEGVNVAEGFLSQKKKTEGGYGGGGGGEDGSLNEASRRATKMRDGFFAETTGGFASSRVARFARPVRLNSHTIASAGPARSMSVSHRNGKRAFPSVSSGAAGSNSGRDEKAKASRLSGGGDPRLSVDTNSEARTAAAAVPARGGENYKNGGACAAPDAAMFASLTVSRMRRAEVTRGLLRAARFFV